MAIAFGGRSKVPEGPTPVPEGTVNGDVLVATVLTVLDPTVDTITPPDDSWTLVDSNGYSLGIGAVEYRCQIWVKIANNEPGSYKWGPNQTSVGGLVNAVVARYTGASGWGDGKALTGIEGTFRSVTTTQPNQYIAYFGVGTALTPAGVYPNVRPADFVLDADYTVFSTSAGAYTSEAYCHQIKPFAGATGDYNTPISDDGSVSISTAIALTETPTIKFESISTLDGDVTASPAGLASGDILAAVTISITSTLDIPDVSRTAPNAASHPDQQQSWTLVDSMSISLGDGVHYYLTQLWCKIAGDNEPISYRSTGYPPYVVESFLQYIVRYTGATGWADGQVYLGMSLDGQPNVGLLPSVDTTVPNQYISYAVQGGKPNQTGFPATKPSMLTIDNQIDTGSGYILGFVGHQIKDTPGSTGSYVLENLNECISYSLALTTGSSAPVDTTPPTITSASVIERVPGNNTPHILTASEAVTWSLLPLDDYNKFTLNGNALTRDTSADFELSGYQVWVRATDAAGNTTDQMIELIMLEPDLITVIGVTTGTTAATFPSGLREGDIVVAFNFRDGSNTAPGLASGWTDLNSSGANTCSVRLSYKTVGIDRAITTSGSATSTIWVFLRPRPGYTLTPGARTSGGGTTNTISYPAMTLQTNDGTSTILAFAGHRSTNTTLEAATVGGLRFIGGVADATDEAAAFMVAGRTSWPQLTTTITGTASGWRVGLVEIKVTQNILSTNNSHTQWY